MTSMPFRLCSRAFLTLSSPEGLRRLSGTGIDRLPARYWPVRDCGDLLHLSGRALGDDLAAVLAGAGAQVDQVVGRVHRALVVLDDHHRVADVAKALERADQLLVVALVKADRRLVEDVHDADETRADLRRKPDALSLAARERGRGAFEREVADADRIEEAQALGDLAKDQIGDRLLRLVQLELGDPLERRLRRLAGERRDVESADGDGERLGRRRAPSQAGHGCMAMSSSTRSRVFSESVFS